MKVQKYDESAVERVGGTFVSILQVFKPSDTVLSEELGEGGGYLLL